jgi:hypothetical protein
MCGNLANVEPLIKRQESLNQHVTVRPSRSDNSRSLRAPAIELMLTLEIVGQRKGQGEELANAPRTSQACPSLQKIGCSLKQNVKEL